MQTGNIKKYAPKARTRFIETMTRQAARYGISSGHKGEGHVAPAEVRGDVLLISALDGQTHSVPKALRGPREALAKWVTQLGFEQAMEQAAYSWFNRLCAIRFMELKGYLDHGRRVLSHPDHEGGFQILDDCLEIDLPGLNAALVRELKLDGTQDEALYRELLLAQCHALHEAMPFLFEPLDDASELLLPDNLTKTDSLIRELVEAIPEQDWQDVEVIGWLYQFYISEKKDQVIGKVVKSEDIPAATQLFTPNWIVQYLVQNSVGRQWLQTYPASPLKAEMPYYIEPAEQAPEVQAQLDAITPASMAPESIKVLDPACGSGHILVEAYKVLKAIYAERGYRTRDIPQLILKNNLFGLDIDDRAAQLAGFALLMKAREDDRRILTRLAESSQRLNVLAMQSSQHLDANTLWQDLNLTGDAHQGQSQSLFESEQQALSSNDASYQLIADLIERFHNAKTFGSLIEVPNELEAPLKALLDQLTDLTTCGDTLQKTAAQRLIPLVQQAWVLAQRYDAVVANPPYMGSKYQTPAVKKYLKDAYKGYEKDLFSAYIVRNLDFAKEHGQLGFMTPFVWMFISSYEQLRKRLIEEDIITSLIQLEYSGFDGATVPICTFTLSKGHIAGYTGSYIRLSDFRGAVNQGPKTLEAIQHRDCGWFYDAKPDDFKKIPGSPVAYWVSSNFRNCFEKFSLVENEAAAVCGMTTGENARFVREWFEISWANFGRDIASRDEAKATKFKWFPYAKGGDFRKWYGNAESVIDWQNDGERIIRTGRASPRAKVKYFKPSVSWSFISSSYFGARQQPPGFIFDMAGCSLFPNEPEDLYFYTSLLCANTSTDFLKAVNPTLNFQVSNVGSIPVPNEIDRNKVYTISERCVEITRSDWDAFEVSWDFRSFSLIDNHVYSLKSSFLSKRKLWGELVQEVNCLEKNNNEIFIKAYGLLSEFDSKVDLEAITLSCNPHYRYGGNRSEEELETLLQCDTLKELVSYAIGCMMGRYSLDKPGLILASQGETVRDYFVQIPKPSFAPDDNAIIPLTDQEWFPDDATNRFRDFVRTVWGDDSLPNGRSALQENLEFVADSLCLHAIKPKKGEAALDTIRRYLSTQFFKDHLRTYKKRPIYWLFSSGKQKAFECLVYLHRYNESTLAEMRTDYVIPLTEKLGSYVEKLEQDKEASASAAEAKRIEKDLGKLYKQQAELNAFDEKLRHYADQRISLDLDDGVKVNYGKFGDLLGEVKAVTGEKAD